MIAAPAAMNAPRITNASRTPINSTFCWYFRGTANRPMMMTKTNRLSTDRLYSVIQPP